MIPLTAFPAFSPPACASVGDPGTACAGADERSKPATLRIQVMTLTPSANSDRKVGGRRSTMPCARRGAWVQVQIIVADWALGEPTQAMKSLAVLPNITVKFSQLPLAPEGFIPYARVEHAKYAIADERSIYIGTGNWEWSYFNTTVDASVFLHGVGPAKTLTQLTTTGTVIT